MIKKIVFIALVIITLTQCSQKNFTEIKNGVQFSVDSISYSLQFYDTAIVRVQKSVLNDSVSQTSLVVIIDSVPDIPFSAYQSGSIITLKSDKLIVEASVKTGDVVYTRLDGSIILQEKGGCAFERYSSPNEEAWTVRQFFSLSDEEAVYGLGQHQYGYMNYRGKFVKLVQTNTDAVVPFLWSTAGYGILWDNYSKVIFDDSGEQTYFLSDVADKIDYYLIADDVADNVIAGYRYLSGHAPMFAKWAYGYWQSKEHYDTQTEILSVATKYRDLNIPIDCMIQDWDYWNGADNWSGMFFDKSLFPTPARMMDSLHNMNFHAIISIWPALGPNTPIYKEMLEKGFLYPAVGWAGFKYYDAYNPQATRLYFKYLKKGLWSKGLDGWWIDSTEPDVVNALTKESTEYEMKKLGSNHLGSFDRYLNTFSLVMTDELYKLIRAETTQRSFILTRSAFAGQQRNGAVTWSGDIGANWTVYKDQIAAGVNHCMSGVPYWTFDIGAFVLGSYGGVFSNGGKDPAYQELYTRMFQFGAFTPIFRSHGSETPREIWEMGEFMPVLIKFDNLRYRLLPYIYSQAWNITNNSYTLMRGLAMDYTDDTACYDIDNQFMFGPSFLACPVTEYQKYAPPIACVDIPAEVFRTEDGKQGLHAQFYKDTKYTNLGLDTVVSQVDVFWYTGRPDYVTDSMFSIKWTAQLTPKESGPYQFHLKSFDAKRIRINGKELEMVYKSVEQYTEVIELEGGKTYNFELETENTSTGAARMILQWKTPEIFAMEQHTEERKTTRQVYLPLAPKWFDFWTGKQYEGGRTITADAQIATMPLYVPAGSIVPMGPFVQYATEKTADTLEIRIYPGADGNFVLYEDENDGYNYENGEYATISFSWNDAEKVLEIGEQNGSFNGMLESRVFNIVVVDETKGKGVPISSVIDTSVVYTGKKVSVSL
ncbi:MAG: DUF5110 domain-containing protein [Bacteroidales bacterium]|jgi:alpha-D-xyloside xylohydrolase|nr:DUF5110 domain-containing protein [Bacteroidales bacterium]